MNSPCKNSIHLLLAAFILIASGCAKTDEDQVKKKQGSREYRTDIWLVDMDTRGDSISFGDPVNITPRRGYDNQPKYLADGSGLLFSVGTINENKEMRTDIFLHDFSSGQQKKMTDTVESEFSPVPMPTGRGFSVVRGESDGTSRLWFVDDQSDATEVILPDAVAVNYYNWIDANRVALLMGGPISEEHKESWQMMLQIGYVNFGEVRAVGQVPKYSRALELKPGSNQLTVTTENDAGEAEISLLDLDTMEFSVLAKPREGSPFIDFTWTKDPVLLMAGDRTIYELTKDGWAPIRDFGDVLPGQITRLAVRPDNKQLAMVVWEMPLEITQDY